LDEGFTRSPNDHCALTYKKATSMTLTKDDIVEAVAEEAGFPKNQSVELVETLIEIIKKTLESGDHVLVSGFGTFRVKEKKERRGRNPKTGEDLMLSPRRVVTFHCSRKLKLQING
jgi:integration host factor subunit alpha